MGVLSLRDETLDTMVSLSGYDVGMSPYVFFATIS